MSMGTSILNLIGRPDPRDKLMRVLAGDGTATPPAEVQYPATGEPEGGVYATPEGVANPVRTQQPQPEAYTSPDDLMGMYKELLDYQSRTANVDRGVALLGSAFAHPENRANIMNAFGGGQDQSAAPDPMAFAKTITDMRSAEVARTQKAAMMAQLPAIAKKYGIDEATAQLLFQNNQLDEFVNKREEAQFTRDNEKPVTAVNHGQTIGFDPRTGKEIFRIGVPDKPKLEFQKVGDDLHIIDDTGNTVRTIKNDDPEYMNITDTDGTTMIVDKKNPTKVMARLGSPKDPLATDDTKEYDRYAADTTAAGGQPKTFEQWQLQNKKAGAQNVTVNNGSQKEFDKQLGQEQAKRYVELQNQAANNRKALDQYSLVEKALDSGLETGTFADVTLAGRKIGDALGMDVNKDKIAQAETIKSVTNQLALLKRNPESGMGLPGSVSDRDLQFLKDADIQLGTSVAGNKIMVKVAKKFAERNIKVADMAADYIKQHGQLDAGWDKQLSDYAFANPLFADLDIKASSPADRKKAAFEKYGVPLDGN